MQSDALSQGLIHHDDGRGARRRLLSGFGAWLALVLLGSPSWAQFDSNSRNETSSSTRRKPAVAALNFRVHLQYDYQWVDETEATNASPGMTSTLEFDEMETHAGSGEIVGTLPLTHSTGLRARVRGAFASDERDPAAGSPDTDTGVYGASVDLFLRDPELGALTLGGDYDRFDGDDDYDANQYTGRAELRFFFPDLGGGPIDWFLDVSFAKRDDGGASRPFGADDETIRLEGGAGWYLDEDVQLVLGGRWSHSEGDVADLDERVGLASLRWQVPVSSSAVSSAVSVELDLGGTVGVSEYEEGPFRSDSRFLYGAHVGITMRFGSGATLLESIRAYD